mmetsp:Transcript_3755/g.8505  ORF Transcript_3755/g.8505 Transcript_3755/m.8505 type:complete len:238 (+) Transcript_3755:131-844(+)
MISSTLCFDDSPTRLKSQVFAQLCFNGQRPSASKESVGQPHACICMPRGPRALPLHAISSLVNLALRFGTFSIGRATARARVSGRVPSSSHPRQLARVSAFHRRHITAALCTLVQRLNGFSSVCPWALLARPTVWLRELFPPSALLALIACPFLALLLGRAELTRMDSALGDSLACHSRARTIVRGSCADAARAAGRRRALRARASEMGVRGSLGAGAPLCRVGQELADLDAIGTSL